MLGLVYIIIIAHDQNCPAKSKTCIKCHVKGHFASVCETLKHIKSRTEKQDKEKSGQVEWSV